MMTHRNFLLVVLSVVACRKEGADSNEPVPQPQPTDALATPDTSTPSAGDDGGAAAAPDGGASDPATADSCVSKCVSSRQMQAISAEMIEKNCQSDCASGKLAP
jgi:hypothetical protein